MDAQVYSRLRSLVTSKAAQPAPSIKAALDFPSAVQQADERLTQSEALTNLRNLALASFGVGAAGRGALGLFRTLHGGLNNDTPSRGGPALLPLPYPVEPQELPQKTKKPKLLKAAGSPYDLSWYTPTMLLGGMGSGYLGWKAVDHVLEKRRQAERDKQLGDSRQRFHDALLMQYDKPLVNGAQQLDPKTATAVLEKAAAALGELWDRVEALLTDAPTKQAAVADYVGDWVNKVPGVYGAYAGLTGLLSGAFMYDRFQKRSRRAILEKAQQRRQRRQFMQSPTEIYAVPEPITQLPKPDFKDEMKLVGAPDM